MGSDEERRTGHTELTSLLRGYRLPGTAEKYAFAAVIGPTGESFMQLEFVVRDGHTLQTELERLTDGQAKHAETGQTFDQVSTARAVSAPSSSGKPVSGATGKETRHAG